MTAKKSKWPDPEPLVHQPMPPPLDALPEVLAQYVDAVATETQTPPDLPLLYGLSVLSASARNAWNVTVREGWSEQLSLWTLVLLPSGNLKSTVETRMMAPLSRVEAELVKQHADELPALQARYKIAKKQADQAAKEAVDSGSTEEAERLAKVAESLRPPPRPRLYATDATPEAAAKHAASQRSVMAVFAAEGAFLQNLAGRYSNNNQANLSFANDAYSGKDTRVVRSGQGELWLPRPSLTLGLSLQNNLARGMGNGDMDSSGFLSRFLYAVPVSLLGQRDLDAPPVSPRVVRDWDLALSALLDQATRWWSSGYDLHHDTRTELSLSAAAQRVLMELREDIEPQLGDTGDLAGMSGWGAKLPGNCVRIAGLFALLESPTKHLIQTRHMKSAVALAPYLVEHSQAAHALLRQTRAIPATPEQRVMRWVAENVDEGDPFKFDPLRVAMRKQAWTQRDEDGESAAVKKVLRSLVEKRWLRRMPRVVEGRGRPATRYEAHPDTWEEWGGS